MRPTLLAIRAIAVDFIMRLYGPVTITAVIVAAALLGLSGWLTTLSSWWWILFGVIALLTLIVGVILLVMWFVIKKVAPKRTKAQKAQARALVDKIQRLTEVAALPKFFLWFQVARDIISPSREGFIASVSNDTTSLHHDFMALRDSFQ